MIVPLSQLGGQAEGLCHSSRGHRPRNAMTLDCSRPVRALQHLCVSMPLWQNPHGSNCALAHRSPTLRAGLSQIKVNKGKSSLIKPFSEKKDCLNLCFICVHLWLKPVAFGRLRSAPGGGYPDCREERCFEPLREKIRVNSRYSRKTLEACGRLRKATEGGRGKGNYTHLRIAGSLRSLRALRETQTGRLWSAMVAYGRLPRRLR
jgi:hypothetical protein